MDSLNIRQLKSGTKEDVSFKLQEKLDIMFQNWHAVQEKAFRIVHPRSAVKYEGLISLTLTSNLLKEDEASRNIKNLEYQSMLKDLLEKLPIFEEELAVPLSLYSDSEIQWKLSRIQVCISFEFKDKNAKLI